MNIYLGREAQGRLEWEEGDQDLHSLLHSERCQVVLDRGDRQHIQSKEMWKKNKHNKEEKIIKRSRNNKEHNLLLRILMKLLKNFNRKLRTLVGAGAKPFYCLSFYGIYLPLGWGALVAN